VKLPFADDMPQPLRSIGRGLLTKSARRYVAASLERLAHLQDYRDPLFRRSQRQLVALKNKFRGESCIIIGNGPSIRGQDLRALSFAKTFCLNRGYLMWREQGVAPDFFVAVNDLVIEQFDNEIASLPCPLFLPWRHHQRFRGVGNAIFLEMRWKEQFFRDITKGLWPGATVTAAALQIAYHLGFSRAILIGVDHRYSASGAPNAEVVQTQSDDSHFSSDYFGKGVRWNLPDLEKSEIAYRFAKTVFEADGRTIIDATSGGALDIFPKMPLSDAMRLCRRPAG